MLETEPNTGLTRERLTREFLKAGNLALFARSAKATKKNIRKWKECLEAKGIRVHVDKSYDWLQNKNNEIGQVLLGVKMLVQTQ